MGRYLLRTDSHVFINIHIDIGVGLPDEESTDRLGKVLSEYAYRIQWRKYFREEIFPRLMAFSPDFIFISAGFDAHRKDTINQGYISLIEDDFEWVTHNLVKIANSCCDGRIVSVLEGGYQLGGEYYSAFAQSAKAHVRSLALSSSCRTWFSVEECRAETKLEEIHLEQLQAQREQQIVMRREQSLEIKQQLVQSAALLSAQHQSTVTADDDLQAQTMDLPIEVSTVEEVAVESVPSLSSAVYEVEPKTDTSGRKRRRPQVSCYLTLI